MFERLIEAIGDCLTALKNALTYFVKGLLDPFLISNTEKESDGNQFGKMYDMIQHGFEIQTHNVGGHKVAFLPERQLNVNPDDNHVAACVDCQRQIPMPTEAMEVPKAKFYIMGEFLQSDCVGKT